MIEIHSDYEVQDNAEGCLNIMLIAGVCFKALIVMHARLLKSESELDKWVTRRTKARVILAVGS